MEMLTVAEAAKILGVSREAVYAAIRDHRLASVKVLGKIGIPKKELKNYKPMDVRIKSGRRSAQSKKPRQGNAGKR